MIASLLIATSTSIQANNNIEVSDSLSKIDLIDNSNKLNFILTNKN